MKASKTKRVTEQRLNAPASWGRFATSKTPVSVMTPPWEVLQASFEDPIKPTEIAYIVVVGNNSRKAPKPKPMEETSKPKYKLEVDDEPKIQHAPKSASVNIVQPKFKLILQDADGQDKELSTIGGHSDISSFTSFSMLDDGDFDEVTVESASPTSKISDIFLGDSNSELSAHSMVNASESEMKEFLVQKLIEIERRERKLRELLQRSGVTAMTDDISYQVAKAKISEIACQMKAVGDSNLDEYNRLGHEMERYHAALVITDEWQMEQEDSEHRWELENQPNNFVALQQLRRHMPVNVRRMTIDELSQTLPMDLAKRFKRTDVLTLLRLDPFEIERMHPSMLESMRVTGLTLTERRALHAHLSPVANNWKGTKDDSVTNRKYHWFNMMKGNFQENLNKYNSHAAKHGPPHCHHCSFAGRSCPIAADLAVDYGGDYGFPVSDEYEAFQVLTQSKQQQNRKDDTMQQKIDTQSSFAAARNRRWS